MTRVSEFGQKNWQSLDQVVAEAWAMLERGAARVKDPFHTPVLGTVRAGECHLRTVVLRGVNQPERRLICHTDVRSTKVAEILQQSQVSWLFYHPTEKVQLRLRGPATLHQADELADQRWAAAPPMSRRCYMAALGPGTLAAEPVSGLPPVFEGRTPTLAESEAGRANFAVITCRIDFMDWLYLRAPGHRRAQFTWQAEGLVASWVAP